MKGKLNIKKLTGLLRAVLFALSMLINNVPDSIANTTVEEDCGKVCSGSMTVCVSSGVCEFD